MNVLLGLKTKTRMASMTVLLLLLSTGLAFGQKYVALKKAPLGVEVAGFYIIEVLDSRTQRDSIGYERVGALRRKVPIDLAPEVPTAVYLYLQEALPKAAEAKAVIFGIDALEVSEALPEEGGQKAVALSAKFYRPSGNQLKLLFEAQVQAVSTEGEKTEALIRNAIGQALAAFHASNWQDGPVVQSVPADSLSGAARGNQGTTGPKLNLLTIGRTLGVYAQGWRLEYYSNREPLPAAKGAWFIPKQLSLMRLEIDESSFRTSDFIQANLNYGIIGISPFRKIGDRLYLALSFNLVLGWESLTNVLGRKASNPLIGINPSQGLYFIPKNNTGFVAGISLYENLSSSKVYGRDIGLRLTAGVKF